MINKTRTNAFLKAFKLGSDPEKVIYIQLRKSFVKFFIGLNRW